MTDLKYRVTFKTFYVFLLFFGATLMLHGCAAPPAGIAGVAAGTVAAVDAGINSLVQSRVIDPASASGILGWVHLAGDTITSLATLPQKIHDMQLQHAADLAAVKAQHAADLSVVVAKIPTQVDMLAHDGGAALAAMSGTQLHRGPVTPASMKTPDAVAVVAKAA
jgi:hypothetical protein